MSETTDRKAMSCPSGKISYVSREDALVGQKELIFRDAARGLPELSIGLHQYACGLCNGWHLARSGARALAVKRALKEAERERKREYRRRKRRRFWRWLDAHPLARALRPRLEAQGLRGLELQRQLQRAIADHEGPESRSNEERLHAHEDE